MERHQQKNWANHCTRRAKRNGKRSQIKPNSEPNGTPDRSRDAPGRCWTAPALPGCFGNTRGTLPGRPWDAIRALMRRSERLPGCSGMLLGRSQDAPGIARTLQNRCSKGIRLQTRFYHHFGMALEAFLGGFLEPKMVLNPNKKEN